MISAIFEDEARDLFKHYTTNIHHPFSIPEIYEWLMPTEKPVRKIEFNGKKFISESFYNPKKNFAKIFSLICYSKYIYEKLTDTSTFKAFGFENKNDIVYKMYMDILKNLIDDLLIHASFPKTKTISSDCNDPDIHYIHSSENISLFETIVLEKEPIIFRINQKLSLKISLEKNKEKVNCKSLISNFRKEFYEAHMIKKEVLYNQDNCILKDSIELSKEGVIIHYNRNGSNSFESIYNYLSIQMVMKKSKFMNFFQKNLKFMKKIIEDYLFY